MKYRNFSPKRMTTSKLIDYVNMQYSILEDTTGFSKHMPEVAKMIKDGVEFRCRSILVVSADFMEKMLEEHWLDNVA
jgi:hypothetical protein